MMTDFRELRTPFFLLGPQQSRQRQPAQSERADSQQFASGESITEPISGTVNRKHGALQVQISECRCVGILAVNSELLQGTPPAQQDLGKDKTAGNPDSAADCAPVDLNTELH